MTMDSETHTHALTRSLANGKAVFANEINMSFSNRLGFLGSAPGGTDGDEVRTNTLKRKDALEVSSKI